MANYTNDMCHVLPVGPSPNLYTELSILLCHSLGVIEGVYIKKAYVLVDILINENEDQII